jgi:hypothetical protein
VSLTLTVIGFAVERQTHSGGKAKRSYATSVRDFGATADDETDDATAIQAALDSVPGAGGTVFVPVGTYRIASPLIIRRNGLTLTGSGTQSVIKLADGIEDSMILLPAARVPAGPPPAELVVTDVMISRLRLDGNGNGSPFNGPLSGEGHSNSIFGIQIYHAERVTIEEVTISTISHDCITVGDGNAANVAVTIRRSHFLGCGRNGIHVGFGTGIRVSQVLVEDTPSQRWGPAAGNSVDVEVEGLNPHVADLVIEDSLFLRTGTQTAGHGVGLQPAFGPVSDVTVRKNVIRNHQVGVAVLDSHSSTVDGNWISADIADDKVTGQGLASATTKEDSSVQFHDNVVNLVPWAPLADSVVYDSGPGSKLYRGNKMWGGECALKTYGATPSTVTTENNQWSNASRCFAKPSNAATQIVAQANNREMSVLSVDGTPPVAEVAVTAGSVVRPNQRIEVKAHDSGSGVARVFLLVDGVPIGLSDDGPHWFALDLSGLAPGPHALAAMAVDNAANLSAKAETAVTT